MPRLSIIIIIILCVCSHTVFGAASFSSIKDQLSIIENELEVLDSSHLVFSRSSVKYELKVSGNIALQMNIQEAMSDIKNDIRELSHRFEFGNTQFYKEFSGLVADYQNKLVRLVAVMFYFEREFPQIAKKHNFPSMKKVRELNLEINRYLYYGNQIIKHGEFAKAMNHPHDDDLVILQVRELDYISIAGSTFKSNLKLDSRDSSHRKLKKDFAHLLQFTATQRALINRGQLSQMDAGNIINESKISCMPTNMYLSENKSFIPSKHPVNREDQNFSFFENKYIPAASEIMSELREEKYFASDKILNRLVSSLDSELSNGLKPYIKEIIVETINEHPEMKAINLKFSGLDSANQNRLLSERFAKSSSYFTERMRVVLTEFSMHPLVHSHIYYSRLYGDDLNSYSNATQAGKASRLIVWKLLKAYLLDEFQLNQSQSEKVASDLTPFIKFAMEDFDRYLLAKLNKKLNSKTISLSKSQKQEHFLEDQLVKSLPFLKEAKLMSMKEGYKRESQYTQAFKKLQGKSHYEIKPRDPAELKSLMMDNIDSNIGGLVDYQQIASKKQLEKLIDGAYEQLGTVFYELIRYDDIGLYAGDYFKFENERVIFDQEAFDNKRIGLLSDLFPAGRKTTMSLEMQQAFQANMTEIGKYAQGMIKANDLSEITKKFLLTRSTSKKLSRTLARNVAKEQRNLSFAETRISSSFTMTELFNDSLEKNKRMETLLWNTALWKFANYFEAMGVAEAATRANISEIMEQQRCLKSGCSLSSSKRSYNEAFEQKNESKDSNALKKKISSYTEEKVNLAQSLLYSGKSQQSGMMNMAMAGMGKEESSVTSLKETHYNFKAKAFNRMLKALGMLSAMRLKGYNPLNKPMYFTVNPGNKRINMHFDLAYKRLTDFYSENYMMRTPYQYKSSDLRKQTMVRLAGALNFTQGKLVVNTSLLKKIIKDTYDSALSNDNGIVEKFCRADINAPTKEFRDIFLNAPLLRTKLAEEIILIEKRKNNGNETKFAKAIKKVEESLADDVRTTGEAIEDFMIDLGMVVGALFMIALIFTGVGSVVGIAGLKGLGLGMMAIAGTKIALSTFILGYAFRMHKDYYRVPAQLTSQYQFASSAILEPIYSDWAEFEKQDAESRKTRYSTAMESWHMADGLLQATFAWGIVKAPFRFFSSAKTLKILKKWDSPIFSSRKIIRTTWNEVRAGRTPLEIMKKARTFASQAMQKLSGNLNLYGKELVEFAKDLRISTLVFENLRPKDGEKVVKIMRARLKKLNDMVEEGSIRGYYKMVEKEGKLVKEWVEPTTELLYNGSRIPYWMRQHIIMSKMSGSAHNPFVSRFDYFTKNLIKSIREGRFKDFISRKYTMKYSENQALVRGNLMKSEAARIANLLKKIQAAEDDGMGLVKFLEEIQAAKLRGEKPSSLNDLWRDFMIKNGKKGTRLGETIEEMRAAKETAEKAAEGAEAVDAFLTVKELEQITDVVMYNKAFPLKTRIAFARFKYSETQHLQSTLKSVNEYEALTTVNKFEKGDFSWGFASLKDRLKQFQSWEHIKKVKLPSTQKIIKATVIYFALREQIHGGLDYLGNIWSEYRQEKLNTNVMNSDELAYLFEKFDDGDLAGDSRVEEFMNTYKEALIKTMEEMEKLEKEIVETEQDEQVKDELKQLEQDLPTEEKQ